MKFVRYQHLERLGKPEVEGILDGTCYFYPKLDGTNASLWMEDGVLKAGSRNRELTEESDNAGFYKWAKERPEFIKFFNDYPDMRLYGEFLVPHTITTYKTDAWRNFYVFDIYDDDGKFYLEDLSILDVYDIKTVPLLAELENPTKEQIDSILESEGARFLLNSGAPEGIVIKNFDFKHPQKGNIWAKLIFEGFKSNVNGTKLSSDDVEKSIVDCYLTSHLIAKEKAKILLEGETPENAILSRLINQLFYTLIQEEMWAIVKELKRPTVDFNKLSKLVADKTRNVYFGTE